MVNLRHHHRFLGKVRYLLRGGGEGRGGGLGLRRGGSSVKLWSNGGGSRVLNLWKSGEGHAFRYRKHKLCKISNAFSAIQGAKFQNFPGEHVPGRPLASECFHVHVNTISLIKHASFTPFIACTFTPLSIPDESFPIWTAYSENKLGVSHIF